ncbi:hypothetical protein [Methanobrevibacter sp.]|uniref:hypothetical protein n=1 Tax=Methanobrevibacter sp. TaxID=66852 RepID=UPI0038905493
MKISETIERISEALKTPEEKPRLYKKDITKTEKIETSELLPTCPGNTVNTLLYSLD